MGKVGERRAWADIGSPSKVLITQHQDASQRGPGWRPYCGGVAWRYGQKQTQPARHVIGKGEQDEGPDMPYASDGIEWRNL